MGGSESKSTASDIGASVDNKTHIGNFQSEVCVFATSFVKLVQFVDSHKNPQNVKEWEEQQRTVAMKSCRRRKCDCGSKKEKVLWKRR